MKSGKENCQFVRPLIESLSSLETYFGLVASDKKVQDIVIEIIILLLETLSSECRLTMCRFIESFMPSLLKFYDQNKDQKKKTSHFKLLNLAVALHHPLGRHQNEEGSLANNWDVWNKYLNSMTEIICLEVNYLQKNRKQNDKSFQQCSYFHSLAASVFHQIFKMSERSENDTETPSKRIKLSVNKNKTFSDLVNELQQNHVPWLGIVNVYTKLYSTHITSREYLLLLNCLQLLLANSSTNLDWDMFKELVCFVLESSNAHMSDDDDYKNTLLSLWNSCVRSCTSTNSSHQAIHTIMQGVLTCNILEYPTHLIKQYVEKEMPVTTHSVTTLINIFQKFYSKCSCSDFRVKCLAWLTAGDSSSFCVSRVPELLLRIISNENITLNLTCNKNFEQVRLHDILFNSLEKCILFSEFEIDGPTIPPVLENAFEGVETDTDLEQQIHEYLKIMLTDNISKRLQTHTELSMAIKLMNVVVTYFDLLIKLNVKTHDEIETLDIYTLLVTALTRMYSSFNTLLENNIQIQYKVDFLQLVNQLLASEFHPILTGLVRSTIDADTFHSINNILNTEVQVDDDDIINIGDEDEMNIETLKKHCLLVLAAYCRKHAEYREDISKLILDEYEYNFTSDTECAFQCIEMLIDSTVQDPPLGLIFTLMQRMCQKLYRDSKATYGILKILLKIMDPLCSDDSSMKDNCFIMIKSYLQLCEDTYYPPRVASLIYECAAKVIVMSRKHDCEVAFIEHILKTIKCNVHSIRLFCCYLVKLINHFPEDKINAFAIDLLDIFLTDLPTVEESILKDEAANRTFTVLHCFVALAQTKKLPTLTIILQVIHIQKVKSLDKQIVLKVLNRITQAFGIQNLANYLNNNILAVVYFWFSKQNAFGDLPISLFGFEDTEMFIEKHMKWLIAGESLWSHDGAIIKSDILKRVVKKHNKSTQYILEICFSNIMALCMPYIVSAKYEISYCEPHKRDAFKKSMQSANRMFQTTGEMLENEQWSNFFVENIGELLLYLASHLRDPEDAEKLFDLKLPRQNHEYFYPKKIFCAILNYFEDLTDGSVLQYLCKNQTITVFKILFELWKAVTQKNLLELKVLALHAYVVFIKSIPLNQPSDAFICNFACNGFTQVVKDCDNKNQMRCYIKGLKIVLDYLLPQKAALMRKALLELLPILLKQIELGFEQECSEFVNYLTSYMDEHMRESEDVVDFLGSMSSGRADDVRCPNLTVFKEKLKTHKISLKRPSYETLLNIHQFLSCNVSHVQQLHRDLDSRNFSEECEATIIHQFVQSLCNVLKSTCDDKTIIEACNCLSIISSYNMKTLVTVPPAYTERTKTVNPTRFFLQVVGKSLLEVLFDQDATITDEVSVTLKNLLKSLDIDEIPDLETLDKEIIKPFSSRSSASAVDTVTDSMRFEEYCTSYPEGIFLNALVAKSSTDWLKEVTCTLLQFIHSPTNYVNNLRQVCSLKSSVCRKILPSLVGVLLQGLSERHVTALGDQIKRFFNDVWDQTFDEILENSGESNVNSKTADRMTHNYMKIIQYMLDIVDFVRIQRNYYQTRRGSAVQTLNYLHLEYDKVAWAAAIIDQNWAAIYYGELWAIFQNNGVSPSAPEITSNLAGGTNLQRIFRKCYVSIGETDAIEGCGTAHLTIENEKRKHLINTGQFTDALLLHDIALSCGGQTDPALHYGVVRSLHKSGMHHLALRYIKSLPENDQLNDVKYDCLAFLGDWSDFVDTRKLEEKYKQKNCNHNSIVKAFQYACLKSCLNVQTTPECENKLILPLNKAKLAVSKLCHNLNMKNCQNIYKVLEKLHILNDVEHYFSVRTNRLHLTDLLRKWDVENLPQFRDFKHIETFSSQRVLLLEHAAKSHSNFLTEIVSLQTQYSQLALNNRRVQMAQRLLAVAKKSKLSEDITLVESEIAWAKGHSEIALSLLRNIIDKHTLDSKLAAVSLRRYGLWMAESKRDNPREIMHKYLKKSLDVLKDEHIDVRLKVYHDIAKFADAEYKQVVTYMNSSIYENRVKCLENMKGTATSLGTKSTKALTKEESRALSTNRKFKELDEAEIVNTQVEKDNYLNLAMRYYLLSLKQCDDNNLSVFRVISLWLDNQNYEFRPEGNETFEALLNSIPSWKFVTVLPQLAPRLTNENTAFMNNLKNLIKRCAIDHPHHTLPILFGLKNSDKDNVIMNASSSIGGSRRARDHEPRVAAALALVTELRARGGHIATVITQMEKLCDAIISFANYMPQSRQKKQKIPDAENIHKLRNLNDIPVPTLTLALRKDCKYTYIHTLQSFDKFYELVGGVNCPKKINCTDSSGKVHILLIKGGDDLKQDAVMQQVFNIVNTLLEKDPVTHKNKLLIRTYKVVPMSRLSGVLEWCEGTIPMGLYLAAPDNAGAHARYRPQDISCDAARKKMIDCSNQSHEVKLAVYNKILKEFKPVFQYFFIEHYLDPVTWYERRLAYTKSVATSSMVGYILGLGDRHMYNILIDKKTAEVIHIDLGIAFEQGKTLRTPETVPFRLTRDIIAGFGSSGTEGTFKRCCEKTMQLLRDNQETLLTILEVLLCDPLYSWSVKTAQQNAPNASLDTTAECASSSPVGLAARALLVVRSKLCGTDSGGAAGVAVPGQVARLLHIAADPFNLCRLFHGWQPYL
ncbi:serine-protein kinase ATM isoform X2 [Trichoplusia ni]|nr:serine-protein kinase ATM isoform X2 [Trichoplusia ni]